jgi:hypothetical protein
MPLTNLFLVGHNLVTSSVFLLDQFLSLGNKNNNLGGMIQRIFVEKMCQSARLLYIFKLSYLNNRF